MLSYFAILLHCAVFHGRFFEPVTRQFLFIVRINPSILTAVN